jgi:CheY-like chemotaxis protein
MNPQDRKTKPPPAQSKHVSAGAIDGFAGKTPMAPQMAQKRRMSTVLCVDDESQIRNIEKRIISAIGHNVETAKDGLEALARVRQGGIDLVISDFQMPKMNGVELTRAIKAYDERIPVIIVSGGGMKNEHYDSLRDLGVTHILPKPLTAENLKIAIGKNLPSEPSRNEG